jgi:hypothetical protein
MKIIILGTLWTLRISSTYNGTKFAAQLVVFIGMK